MEERLRSHMDRMALKDERGLSALYDETSAIVYGLTLRILRDPADAEEVTLDVYSQAWRNAPTFDRSRGKVTTWLLLMARSRAIDRLRSRQRQREDPLDIAPEIASQSGGPEESTFIRERRTIVAAALAKLPGEQRKLIELAFFYGLSHTELAEKLGQPLGTVKTRIRAGMLRLREELGALSAAAQ
jgi:RNA polymerase sigma-70 factor (ECF subfamily)